SMAGSSRTCASIRSTWRGWKAPTNSSGGLARSAPAARATIGRARVAEQIVDFRVKLPTRDSRQDPQPPVPEEYLHYDEVYEGFLENLELTLEDWIAEAERFGVGPSVMQAEVEWADPHELNDRLAAVVRAHPEHVACGFGCVDPRKVMDAVR